MIIIIGLGNPGEKFKNTRHNTGFVVIDEFAKEQGFPEFKFSKKFNADVSKKTINDNEIVLAKPQTFMNESGRTVKKIISFLPRPAAKRRGGESEFPDLWIIHDDLDLEIGQIKIVKNRGPAGHNGIKSIVKNLGTKYFVRFRVGIRPITSPRPPASPGVASERGEVMAKDFVLGKFTREEKEILKQSLQKTVEAIETSLKQGIEKGMSEYN